MVIVLFNSTVPGSNEVKMTHTKTLLNGHSPYSSNSIFELWVHHSVLCGTILFVFEASLQIFIKVHNCKYVPERECEAGIALVLLRRFGYFSEKKNIPLKCETKLY